MQVKKYAIVAGGAVVNIVESSAEFAEYQGWILADRLSIGDVRTGTGFAPPIPDIGALKANKNAEINSSWLAANLGTFEFSGKLIGCDQLSRSNIDGANGFISLYGQLPPGWPGGWKAADDSYVPIGTVETWKVFYAAMFAAGNANFGRAQHLKRQLDAAKTLDEINAITWGNP